MRGNEASQEHSLLHNFFETLATAGTNRVVPYRGSGLDRFLGRTAGRSEDIDVPMEYGPAYETEIADLSKRMGIKED